jgi:hypothetical protein
MARGRHRAKRQRRLGKAIVLAFALGCALAAATLTIVADDPRLLRAAVLGALLAAFVPTLLPTLEQQPSTAVDDELRRLRRELAKLRGELDALIAAGWTKAPERTAALQLPLIRAALRAAPPSSNGNGHHPHTIDLTQEPATTR